MAKKKPYPEIPGAEYPYPPSAPKPPMPVEDDMPGLPGVSNPAGSFSRPAGFYPQQNPAEYNSPGTPYVPNLVTRDPNGTVPAYDPKQADIQKGLTGLGYAMPVEAGLGAGSQVTATPNAQDATLQTVGSGLAGAAGGALAGASIGAAGGPIGAAGGAVIGGAVGLVSGGIQAYNGLRSAREARRKQERVAREIQSRADARYMQERRDAQEQKRYERKTAALQTMWAAVQEAGRRMNDMMTHDDRLKQLFIEQGR